MEQRITAAKGLAAAVLLAGALLVGVSAASPAQAHAAQKQGAAAASTAASASKSAATKTATVASTATTAAPTASLKALGNPVRGVQPITRKKARRIALDDACYKKKQVKKMKVRPGNRSGQEAFVVTFKYKKIKYSYAIARWGGGIISRSAHMSNAAKLIA